MLRNNQNASFFPLIFYMMLSSFTILDQAKDTYRTIERLLDRRSPLFRLPHDQLNNERTGGNNSDRICEILTENFTQIRLRLDVKTLDEYYNAFPSDSQLYSKYQQQLMQSTENVNINTTNGNRAFTDLNLRMSKRSIHSTIPAFKIDYTLVNRVELNWPVLFAHLVARLKSSIIYHFVTLRFEFQGNSATSLNDQERTAVAKLIELLPLFFNEKT